MRVYDAIVVGGGPGGLSAALVLGRCRRSVLLFDLEDARNLRTLQVNGFLAVAGCGPLELRTRAKEQLAEHRVELVAEEVVNARLLEDGSFQAETSSASYSSRRLILATGLRDNIPPQEGFQRHYGRGVYTCPYCDGWENRDQPLAVYGKGERGYGFALELSIWSKKLTLCTDGWNDYPLSWRNELSRHGIELRQEAILAVRGDGERLKSIDFIDGSSLECQAMFLATGQEQRCELGRQLGAKVNSKGILQSSAYGQTTVAGLYAVGDSDGKLQMAIAAAADGARAAYQVNQSLFHEDMSQALEVATRVRRTRC